MKKISIIIASLAIILPACFLWDGDEERFKETYKEILIAREMISDSLEANEEVNRIREEHGYTEQSFMDEYIYYANKDREKFIAIMDSIREEARLEITKINEDNYKNQSKEKKDSVIKKDSISENS